MYGLCFPPGIQQFFFLDKGKAIGSPLCRAAPEDAADLFTLHQYR